MINRTAKMVLARSLCLARGTATMMGFAVMLAVVLGVGTTALAAVPGDPFRLGQMNAINNALTTLAGSRAGGAMMLVDNNSSTAGSRALDLRTEPGRAPMTVNVDAGKVSNLDADKLDGNDASEFLGADDQAASATNADQVDSKDANELVRVASFTGDSPLPDGTVEGNVATTEINAPSRGFLVIDASSDFRNVQARSSLCSIKVDDNVASGSQRLITFGGPPGGDPNESPGQDDCSTNAVVPVVPGNHTVDLNADIDANGTIEYGDTVLSVLYIPFDGDGRQPFILPFDPPTPSSPAR